jgi:hypothetical protein
MWDFSSETMLTECFSFTYTEVQVRLLEAQWNVTSAQRTLCAGISSPRYPSGVTKVCTSSDPVVEEREALAEFGDA